MGKLFFTLLFLTPYTFAAVDKTTYDEISQYFEQRVQSELPNNEQIIFNPPMEGSGLTWWEFDTFRASYNQMENQGQINHYIFVFGGLARAEFMTKDGMALIICHEIGHGIGGAPYKRSGSSTEGQSDYYSTGTCLLEYFESFPRVVTEQEVNPDKQHLCNQHIGEFSDIDLCFRALTSIENRVEKFRVMDQVETSIFSKDPLQVSELDFSDLFYPGHQCRIDTLVAGLFKQPRPACWYPERI